LFYHINQVLKIVPQYSPVLTNSTTHFMYKICSMGYNMSLKKKYGCLSTHKGHKDIHTRRGALQKCITNLMHIQLVILMILMY